MRIKGSKQGSKHGAETFNFRELIPQFLALAL